MDGTGISDEEFGRFRRLLYDLAGIRLADTKKGLVTGRLGRRLRHHGLSSFGDYYRLVADAAGGPERQVMLDLLTTNETHFFREPKHFDLLRERILPSLEGEVRVWSAACSSGEEPYSIAMVLADVLRRGPWRITATDISRRVLAVAREAVYPLAAAQRIPGSYLRRFCQRGVRSQAGNFRIDRELRERVRFAPFNLNGAHWSALERVQVVFLRNVMIYFDQATKVRLLERVGEQLLPGGWLLIGHSESITGLGSRFAPVLPSVYRLR